MRRQRAMNPLLVNYIFRWISKHCPNRYNCLFEETNNMKVNVFMLDEQYDLFPAYVGEEVYLTTVDLLLIEKEIDGLVQGHYVLIPQLGRFIGKSGHDNMCICEYCMQPIALTNTRHATVCRAKGEGNMSVPKSDEFRFNRFYAHMDVI
jgi:hypothetical protein